MTQQNLGHEAWINTSQNDNIKKVLNFISNQVNLKKKPQWTTIIPTPEWLKLERMALSSVGDVEHFDFPCTVSGSMNFCNHFSHFLGIIY